MIAGDLGLLAAPMAAGLLVLATHVPLGIEVLRRGIIFLDLAVAQMAALGMLVAHLLGWDAPDVAHGLGAQLAAAVAAVLGALLLTWCEKRWPQLQEALIGLLFVVAASAGILLLADNPHGGEHLRDLLGGQILWVGWDRLPPLAAFYGLLLAAWFGLRERLGRAGFYLVFALAVTASVQLVGVFLVFASLIAPAVASHALRRGLVAAWVLGGLGYAGGLLCSLLADLPAGAAVVCALGLLAVLALLATRQPAE
ncbi:metal ABC transporter permease [Sulfurisoma sediminicola]|uniref:Zinc/manganese transport system permease protein n=1 Tax=Sulfurisoma sediminicola TaxID=1381557 RepID=A0A497XKM2_9PROT|nr:metal ABC transporter permease [Sulfurisoma sediminicola]RLJ67947.1 zinc/manganese transport system permease protein [Sulfurisoma sediminicola]